MPFMMKHLSQNVRSLRRKRGWTQEDLAREISVSLSTVQRWEKRDCKPIRIIARELERLFKESGIGAGKIPQHKKVIVLK